MRLKRYRRYTGDFYRGNSRMMDALHYRLVERQVFGWKWCDIPRKERKRDWWPHPALSNRLSTGQFHFIFETHRKYPEKFVLHYKMSTKSFVELLRHNIEPHHEDRHRDEKIHSLPRFAPSCRLARVSPANGCKASASSIWTPSDVAGETLI